MDQKQAFLASLFQKFDFQPSDYTCFHRGSTMLVLILPLVSQQLRWELGLDFQSKYGHYNLPASVNIILERSTESVRRELVLAESEIKLPFLKHFGLPIRLVGMK